MKEEKERLMEGLWMLYQAEGAPRDISIEQFCMNNDVITYSSKNDDLSDVSLTMQYGNITSGEKKISYVYDQLGRLKNVTRLAGED